jgi:hypothetical protein
MPTMPPAGPDRIASLPWKACASVSPPEDCMKNSGTPGIWAATWSTAAQDGREVGVDHGGVAAADELHQRAGLVAGTDLREADLPRDARRRLLVRGVAPAVHEDDRHAAQPAS